VLWFGVLGAPVAWGIQFGVGYWITQAQCSLSGGGWESSSELWSIALTVVAATVAIAAGLVAVLLFLATRQAEKDGPPPDGRTHFLSIVGIAITPLFTFIIVMNGVGANVLAPCQGS
jgi:heme/copper-type cytochrome/quinol oxidase subunit 2